MIVDLTVMLFLAFASYYDLKHSKIPNRLIVVFGLFGVLLKMLGLVFDLSLLFYGTFEIKGTLVGVVSPLLILLPLWLIKAMGAGDIKLMMALGMTVGTDIFVIGFYSFAVSAMVGLYYLVKRGVLKKRLFAVAELMALTANEKRIVEYKDGIGSKDAVMIAFAPCVMIGMAIFLILKIVNGGIN